MSRAAVTQKEIVFRQQKSSRLEFRGVRPRLVRVGIDRFFPRLVPRVGIWYTSLSGLGGLLLGGHIRRAFAKEGNLNNV
jgi:hypothetical protein